MCALASLLTVGFSMCSLLFDRESPSKRTRNIELIGPCSLRVDRPLPFRADRQPDPV